MRIFTSARLCAGTVCKHILAACEPPMARMYWPCLQARSEIQDRRANQPAVSWYLNSALRAGGKDGGR